MSIRFLIPSGDGDVRRVEDALLDDGSFEDVSSHTHSGIIGFFVDVICPHTLNSRASDIVHSIAPSATSQDLDA